MRLKSIFQILFKGKAEDEHARIEKQSADIAAQQAQKEQMTDTDDEIDLSMEEQYRTCPNCGGRKYKLELLCYYHGGDIIWSDFRHVLPEMATPSLIQKCPHCGRMESK